MGEEIVIMGDRSCMIESTLRGSKNYGIYSWGPPTASTSSLWNSDCYTSPSSRVGELCSSAELNATKGFKETIEFLSTWNFGDLVTVGRTLFPAFPPFPFTYLDVPTFWAWDHWFVFSFSGSSTDFFCNCGENGHIHGKNDTWWGASHSQAPEYGTNQRHWPWFPQESQSPSELQHKFEHMNIDISFLFCLCIFWAYSWWLPTIMNSSSGGEDGGA